MGNLVDEIHRIMKKNTIITLTLLLGILSVFTSCSGDKTSSGRTDRPNIVLLMADDMGFECLSSNGCLSYSTPVLDELADRGIKFNYTISQPLCTPSRVKIMTGKYNYRNYKAFTYLDPNEKTFGNYLKDAGYSTCVVGKWQLSGEDKVEGVQSDTAELLVRPQHFGFDEYSLWNFIGESGNRFADPKIFQNGEVLGGLQNSYGPDVVSNYAMDFMERNKDQPFFLYYPMILVHSPFLPTPDSEEWKDPGLRLKQEDRFFKDMVEYTDKIVNTLVEKVEELGLSENTIFIFTADNGTHVRLVTQTVNGPYPGGKGTMPDAGCHVPMVVYNPSKVKKPVVYNELFEFSDFLPTFLDFAGVPLPEGIDGESFYQLFSGKKQKPRKTVFVHYDPLKGGGSERHYGRFVRNKEYKLYNDGRFYNVGKDKLEKNSISEDALSPELKELRNSFQEELNTAPPHDFKQTSQYGKQK
jgi:arylsulfatase A